MIYFNFSFFLDETVGVKEFKKNNSNKFGDTNFLHWFKGVMELI